MKPPRKIVANELRENQKHFVNSEIGPVPWQLDYVKSFGEMRGDKENLNISFITF